MGRTIDSTLRWTGRSDYVAYTGTSAASAAFGANTHDIRVVATTDCHINIGDGTPTAAASDNNGFRLPAGVVEYFHVSPGQKIAAVQDSTGGTLCVAEMTR
jgi:hypothetical protein